MEISVVVPVYNEAENVEELFRSICEVLQSDSKQFELIFVDDGSEDETLAILRSLVAEEPRTQVVKLRKNFGQTAALRAGIECARGEIIVTMDGDLQNDPKDIPRLVEKIEEGYDLVSGWRKDRKDRLLLRKIPSKIANWIIANLMGVRIHDTGCALKAYRAELIKQLPLYSDLHRFIPAMSTMVTSRFAEVVVSHHARRYGKSKYGLSRVGKVIIDILTIKMLTSFSKRPLHWFGIWAVGFLLLSMLAVSFWVASALDDESTSHISLYTAALLGYVSIHLFVAGIIGELVVRTDGSQRLRPITQRLSVSSKTQDRSDDDGS